jgi:hypothetical protein
MSWTQAIGARDAGRRHRGGKYDLLVGFASGGWEITDWTSALGSSRRLTIFNAANEKDAFAASLPATQDGHY